MGWERFKEKMGSEGCVECAAFLVLEKAGSHYGVLVLVNSGALHSSENSESSTLLELITKALYNVFHPLKIVFPN